jgi:hypothetical protein
MSTKQNPGKFDCYSNAEPDEPMFVLLARDPAAPLMVLLWSRIREKYQDKSKKFLNDNSKIQEARDCADEMRKWMADNRPDKNYDVMETAFADVISEIAADSIKESFNQGHGIL